MGETAILRLKKIEKINPDGTRSFNSYDDLYRHIEGTKYKNLRTNKEWDIPDEKAAEIFTISYNATMMINKYPIIEELILKLKLKLE